MENASKSRRLLSDLLLKGGGHQMLPRFKTKEGQTGKPSKLLPCFYAMLLQLRSIFAQGLARVAFEGTGAAFSHGVLPDLRPFVSDPLSRFTAEVGVPGGPARHGRISSFGLQEVSSSGSYLTKHPPGTHPPTSVPPTRNEGTTGTL